jgi:deoxyinosine 3'endonuclease (endonuclease V)
MESYDYNNLKGQERFKKLLSQRDEQTREKWMKEQNDLKTKLIQTDVHNWKVNLKDGEEGEKLRYIGGVDISFDKYDKNVGISGLVVCDAQKDFEIVYDDYKFIKIEEPYIPSFLAFREVKPYVELINNLKEKKPNYVPQVILVDGNGIMHTRGFGIASHLGVLVDIPTIGCAKTVFALKDEGITDHNVKDKYYEKLKKFGDSFPLTGKSGITWGYALRSTEYYDDPMIISIGHKVSNQTALEVAKMCCYYKEPEPIRLADLITRRLIKAYQKFIYQHPNRKWSLDKYYNENYKYIHDKLYP